MKRKRFTEEQIIAVLKEHEAGAKTAGAGARFLLTFKANGQGPGGQTIQRIVRVVADAQGKVLKISTSR